MLEPFLCTKLVSANVLCARWRLHSSIIGRMGRERSLHWALQGAGISVRIYEKTSSTDDMSNFRRNIATV